MILNNDFVSKSAGADDQDKCFINSEDSFNVCDQDNNMWNM